MIHHGLGGPGRAGTGQKQQRQGRTPDVPDAAGQRTQQAFPVLPDTEPGQGPYPGQQPKPGQTHPGRRAENADIGKIIRQRPYAGIEPAELPVVRPDGQAESGKGCKQHQRQIRPPRKLPGGRYGQYSQRKGKSHEQKPGRHIVSHIKDRAGQSPADGEPHQHG